MTDPKTVAKIERFAAFVAQDPGNTLHRFALAQTLAKAGRDEEAEAAFGDCLELDPEWMMAAIKRARCLVVLERWDEARRWLERGAALAEAQNHEEPFEEIRELMDQLPDA